MTMQGTFLKLLFSWEGIFVKQGMSVFLVQACALFFHTQIPVVATRNFNNLLAREVYGQRVWRRDDQTNGRDEHVHASGTRHIPLAALIIVLQDALIPFVHDFL